MDPRLRTPVLTAQFFLLCLIPLPTCLQAATFHMKTLIRIFVLSIVSKLAKA